jgi:hypothetical protein
MRKALRMMAVLAAFGLTAWIGVVALAQGSSAPTPSTSTTASPAPTVRVDVKGNCDEAEHANDPECVDTIPVAEDDHRDNDQADVNDDHGGDVNDDDQGENEGDDDQGDNSGPGSENSGPGGSNTGSES